MKQSLFFAALCALAGLGLRAEARPAPPFNNTPIIANPPANPNGRPPANVGANSPAPAKDEGNGPKIGQPVQTKDGEKPKSLLKGDDFQLMEATSVDDWIAALPNWNAVNAPKSDKTQTSNGGSSTATEDGRTYNVTRTNYSITETPEEIVTFQPVNGFWLGGLVQQKNLQLGIGSMEEIPVPAEKRASFKVSTDLPMAQNYMAIGNPSSSAVSSALGSLMQKGNGVDWGGARTISIVENYNEEQTAHDLGISAQYATAKLKAALKTSSSNSVHTVTAAFIERAFTAQADFEGRSRRPAFFHDSFTLDDAKELTTQKLVTMTNLPTYIKSITYGRVVLFNLSSSLSESEMKEALSASYNGGTWSVNGSYSGDQKIKSTQFQLRVTSFGGPQNGFDKLIPATGIGDVLKTMNSFLQQKAPLSTMVPISYTANTVRDNQLASLARTTEYTVTKSVPNPIGERYKVKMWLDVTGSDDGIADNTLECYGSLRINGDVWWSISRDEADGTKREKGQQLLITEDAAHTGGKKFEFDAFYNDHKPLTMVVDVFDKDSGSKDDKFGGFNVNLDFLDQQKAGAIKNGVGDYTFDWNSGHGESSRLHLRVERIDYL